MQDESAAMLTGVVVSDDDDARLILDLYRAFARGDRALADFFAPGATMRADPLLGAVREPYPDFQTFYGDLAATHPELTARLKEVRTVGPGRVLAMGEVFLRGGSGEIASVIAWGWWLNDGKVVHHIAELEPATCFRELEVPADAWPSTSSFVGGEVLVAPRDVPADG